MEEISNIFYEIRANIKALPLKAKSNSLLILVFIFLLYTSYDIKHSFRKSAYHFLMTGILTFLILFNFFFVKSFLTNYLYIPISNYIFGEDEKETYEAKHLLK